MPINTISCQTCGKLVNFSDAYFSPGDDDYFCKRHYLAKKILDRVQDCENLKQWLNSTHLGQIRKWEAEILELNQELQALDSHE